MENSEIRHAVELLATAYRELAILVDRAELEALAGHGQEVHVLALRKACRDLTDFGEIVGSLAEEADRQSAQENLEFESRGQLRERLHAAGRIQLEGVLRTQERLLREVGVDGASATQVVEECRAALRLEPDRPRFFVWDSDLRELFVRLAGETCRLAEDFERLAALEAEEAERRARARRVLRVSLSALAAAAAVGIGLVATPIVGFAAASVLQALAGVLLDDVASAAANAFPADRVTDGGEHERLANSEVTAPDQRMIGESESSKHASKESRQRAAGEDAQGSTGDRRD